MILHFGRRGTSRVRKKNARKWDEKRFSHTTYAHCHAVSPIICTHEKYCASKHTRRRRPDPWKSNMEACECRVCSRIGGEGGGDGAVNERNQNDEFEAKKDRRATADGTAQPIQPRWCCWAWDTILCRKFWCDKNLILMIILNTTSCIHTTHKSTRSHVALFHF